MSVRFGHLANFTLTAGDPAVKLRYEQREKLEAAPPAVHCTKTGSSEANRIRFFVVALRNLL